jgi:hypothetical protein
MLNRGARCRDKNESDDDSEGGEGDRTFRSDEDDTVPLSRAVPNKKRFHVYSSGEDEPVPTTKQRRVHSSCDESDSSCEEDSSCDDDGTRADGNCDGTPTIERWRRQRRRQHVTPGPAAGRTGLEAAGGVHSVRLPATTGASAPALPAALR